MKVNDERWRPVVGFENDYAVSDLGRVMSFRGGKRTFLRPGLTSVGYPSVALGRGKTHLVHRLVAAAFLGPCPVGQEVRHKDGTRDNCCVDNLEYGTRSDNVQDAIRHGTFEVGRAKMRKIPIEEHEAIRERYSFRRVTQKDIAEDYGVKVCVVGKILRAK